jgi:dienelactone hydrolase
MEKQIKIKVSEKKYIYGGLRGSSHQPLFIIVHGLSCSMDEDLYVNATRWFSKQGYATFRFNFYGAEKDSRQLIESTLRTHASDIDTIVRYFHKKKFKKIFIAGHSYGGPSILLSKDQKFDGAVLWDPSYKISFTKTVRGFPAVKYIKEIKGYLMNWGVNIVIGKAMADEADNLNWNDLAKNFNLPLKIIAAGKGKIGCGIRHYFKTANKPKDLTIIKNATHYFNDTEKMNEDIFKISSDWFEKK